MKKTINIPAVLLGASIGTAIISVTVRIILSLTQLDVKYGVYSHGSVIPTVYHISLSVILLILGLTAFITAPNRGKDYTIPSNNAGIFISCAVAFLLLANLVSTIYNIYHDISVLGTQPDAFDIFEIIFAIPATVFFFTFISEKAKRPSMRIFFSFFPTAWCTSCLIRIYFDTVSLNTSPNKILGEIALLATMLYFLNESRFLLRNVFHRFYLATASVAPVLLLTSGIPNLMLPSILPTNKADNALHCAVEITFALFIWIRFASYAIDNNKAQAV